MLDDAALTADFDGLIGAADVKPFECIGTVEEVRFALRETLRQYRARGEQLPVLLDRFAAWDDGAQDVPLMKAWNDEHDIPAEFLPSVKEMYGYVSSAD